MGKRSANLQDGFLNQIRKENAEINLILLDGSNLSGKVRGFDNFTVVLESDDSQHLVYKHAIAQIVYHHRSGYGSMHEVRPNDQPAPRDRDPRSQGSEPGKADPAKAEAAKQDKGDSKKEGFNTIDLSKVVLP